MRGGDEDIKPQERRRRRDLTEKTERGALSYERKMRKGEKSVFPWKMRRGL